MSDIPRAEDASRLTDDARSLVTERASDKPLSKVEQLAAFHVRGLLSDEEFELAKERIAPTWGSLS